MTERRTTHQLASGDQPLIPAIAIMPSSYQRPGYLWIVSRLHPPGLLSHPVVTRSIDYWVRRWRRAIIINTLSTHINHTERFLRHQSGSIHLDRTTCQAQISRARQLGNWLENCCTFVGNMIDPARSSALVRLLVNLLRQAPRGAARS